MDTISNEGEEGEDRCVLPNEKALLPIDMTSMPTNANAPPKGIID